MADKRRDAHFKLAHELCDHYDLLCFEYLNLDGMKRLWGRKVSDLAFGQFLTVLKHVATKHGKVVVQRTHNEPMFPLRVSAKPGTARANLSLRLLWPGFRPRPQRGDQYLLRRGIGVY